ncbi:MAG TPA: DNA-binding domain-containing protein [Steroidobacteraceae bacterium]|nr:DNA-binding domain-containing protein [Steroidobacteraceae bacterium]
MLSLRELQSAFGAALLAQDRAGAGDHAAGTAIEQEIVANGLEPAARLRIYRNNARENFASALRAAFPVLAKLVGEDYFRQLALQYRAAHPSRSGDLRHVGQALPDFLSHRFADGEYSYFPDVARLEWAVQEAFVADDHAPLDLARLGQIDPARYTELSFELHPAARLLFSPYPVLTIWRANQDGAEERSIDLHAGGEHVLVTRAAQDVELAQLDPADYAFLSACARGAQFADAVARASGAGPFDASTSLRRHVTSGTLVDFRLTGDPA